MTAMRKLPPALHSRFGDVPEGLDAVVRRCLAHDRAGRFGSVVELRDALAQVEQDFARGAEVRQRAAVTARNRVVPSAEVAGAHRGRLRRTMLLAALGPASAVISMAVVRIVLAILH